jgi:antitoxin component of MazEF toxin-antitoxin module
MFERKIVHVGKSSLAVIIPYAFVRELGIKKGDFISFKLKGKKLLLEKLEQEAAQSAPMTPPAPEKKEVMSNE